MPLDTETPTSRLTPSVSVTTASVEETAKTGRKKKIVNFNPYIGLLGASLKMQDGLTAWEINDLRENVTGGDETWTEKVYCLLCGAAIN